MPDWLAHVKTLSGFLGWTLPSLSLEMISSSIKHGGATYLGTMLV